MAIQGPPLSRLNICRCLTTPDWPAADRAYQHHHAAYPQCRAAGRVIRRISPGCASASEEGGHEDIQNCSRSSQCVDPATGRGGLDAEAVEQRFDVIVGELDAVRLIAHDGNECSLGGDLLALHSFRDVLPALGPEHRVEPRDKAGNQ